MSVTELVIDRIKWGRMSLHNKDGTMCCLGHLSRACGITDEQMPPDGTIAFPLKSWVNVNEWARTDLTSGGGGGASIINDGNLNNDEKETRLIKLFAENGVALSFIGEHRENAEHVS